MPFDLHALARRAVCALHPDERVTLYRSNGQSNRQGRFVPSYQSPLHLMAQVQSEKEPALDLSASAPRTEETRRFYLFTPQEAARRKQTVKKAIAREASLPSEISGDDSGLRGSPPTEHQTPLAEVSPTTAQDSPAGIVRRLARTGDLLQRPDGSWWLVTAIIEDFSASGWVCLRGILQNVPPAAVAPERAL